MRIDAYIGNPIIATQQDYYALEELLHEVEPDCRKIILGQERLIIENLSRRTFHYPRNPTIGWVAGRLRYMVDNGL
ncbi:cephalosporin hydroxylase family protein [Bacteroides ovatus]|uniref:cephalosporin hydroxylase family protein n=1 Tax=Bacteroides ovatus TaxID=28116 RepID=UPI001CDBEB9C|nr:cephalosporin hydroxylase family protein [Bacteroides ovatus]MCA4529016.1 cephalosporin hydroxylase family protein [Bacteroides ovatus]MCA4542657.1 cephalosporin hydroxylase family protein [Bacteroides ovatus]MCA4575149.1 cephalosporin hydroxylase family protein [Bacteroides ovatus]